MIRLVNQVSKEFLKSWVRFVANREFRQRYKKIFQVHPENRNPVNRNVEKNHAKLWSVLRKDINLDTLRLCCNLSGKNNPEIVPEEVFASDIQRSLCRKQEKIEYLGNKSFYNRWYPGNIFPKVFVHNIEGSFLDDQYKPLMETRLNTILEDLRYPVVIKPSMDSWGGADVYFPKDKESLEKLMTGKKNYVIQEKIQQHEFFAKYNRYGLNTVRVNLYRSVVTNKMHYLNACLRMGREGSLDNLTAGGILCSILEDGSLNHYAVDKYGGKYKKHPDTKLEFSKESSIPAFDEMKQLAVKVARDMYLSRLMSLDLCLDEDSQWRVIEINLFDIAIRTAQWGEGQPFFGPFTEEVIKYCKLNPWWKS